MRALIARAKRSMFAAQQRQKRYYDNNRTDKQFAVGDKVLLSTVNLALKILRNGTRKLAPKWVGPFNVTELVGSLGYRLELPDTMLVHDVFHVCYLRGYKDDGRKAPPPVPELDDEGEQDWEVNSINLVLYRITKSLSKATSISSSTYCGFLVTVVRKTYGLMMLLSAKKVYRTTGTRNL